MDSPGTSRQLHAALCQGSKGVLVSLGEASPRRARHDACALGAGSRRNAGAHPSGPGSSGAGPGRLYGEPLGAFERWRLDLQVGGPAAVRVSEFADLRPAGDGCAAFGRGAYGRPANKRDLGHRCHHCRRPFSALGASIIAELQGGGPALRYHEDCWARRGDGEPATALRDQPAGLGAAQAELSAVCLVTAYADEWRRSALEAAERLRGRSILWPVSPRPPTSVLEGLVSMEDSSGERRIARGFVRRELEAFLVRWAWPVALEECAICLTAGDAAGSGSVPSPGLKLPCGHAFCRDCAAPWLEKCALCPMCRCDLRAAGDRLPRVGAGRGSAGSSVRRRRKREAPFPLRQLPAAAAAAARPPHASAAAPAAGAALAAEAARAAAGAVTGSRGGPAATGEQPPPCSGAARKQAGLRPAPPVLASSPAAAPPQAPVRAVCTWRVVRLAAP